MQNSKNLRWNAPKLKTVGTLRDVAGNGAGLDQSNGGGQGNGKS